jgi:putative SOS response-associated peptidase YedK
MCGRFDIHSAIELIAFLFQIDALSFDIVPNYNVAPAQNIPTVVNDGKKNILISSRWGFLPSWTKEKKTAYPMINARGESVDTNKSYKDAFINHRCLVVADGFYEWRKQERIKIPYYIRLKSKQPMAFAGLYNNWSSPEGEEICSSAIITTDANELVMPLHDRMPVILHQNDFKLWLDPNEHDRDALKALLKSFPSEELEAYRVTSKVNSARYNAPENIEPENTGFLPAQE